MVGKTISHYKILEKIGAGGMGEVFLAEDTSLQRKVALKFLPSLQDNPTARKRFLWEARAAAALDHPFICKIHETGEVDGQAFIAFEYVEGDTLQRTLQKGPLALKRALQIGLEVTEALAEAHEKGIIHRDLKPSNIMITRKGHVKVMDFGLAKRLVLEAEEQDVSTCLTTEGAIVGTLAYMSPEQVRGQPLDARSDIFSFGVVLYELLTGVDPFRKETQHETASAILNATPAPLFRYVDDVPPILQHILRKTLAKEAERRYQSIQDVRVDLEEMIEEITKSSMTQAGIKLTAPEQTAPQPLRSPRYLAVLLGAVITGALIGAAVWTLKPAVPEIALRKFELPVENLGIDPWFAISPDGKKVAYVAAGRLCIREFDQLEPLVLSDREGVSRVFWSPDSAWIGCVSANKLWKVSATGGSTVIRGFTRVADLQNQARRGAGATWGPDGRIVFSQGSTGLLQVPAAGGDPQMLLDLDPETDLGFHHPHLLPNGRGVLFVVKRKKHGTDTLALFAEQKRKMLLQLEGQLLWSPIYSPSGHILYSRWTGNWSIWAVPFSVSKLEVTGKPFLIASEGMNPSVSADGTLVYVRPSGVSGTPLVWVDRGGVDRPVTKGMSLANRRPQLSPDGQRIVIDFRDGPHLDVGIYDIKSDVFTKLTLDGASWFARWSSNGRQVVYASGQDNTVDNLYLKAADGAGEVERLTASPYRQLPNSWSPDGKFLAFGQFHSETRWDIYVLPLGSDRQPYPFVNTKFQEEGARFSPDGKWLAYISDESGRDEVYVKPFPDRGGRWQISAGGGVQAVWAPNGKELFYRNGAKMMVVSVETQSSFRAGTPRLLYERSSYGGSDTEAAEYDISPDGQRLLMYKVVSEREGRLAPLIIVLNWFEELKRLVPTGE